MLVSNLVSTTPFWNNRYHVTLKVKRLESQIISVFLCKKTKDPEQDS